MQTVTKGKKVYCRTADHYPPEIVRSMKKAGYTVKETEPATSKKKKGGDG